MLESYHHCTLATFSLIFAILAYALSFPGQWLLSFLLKCLPSFTKIPLPQRLGRWAVITGASDGIGEALAKELYKKGMNLLLISRNEERLNNAKERIKGSTNSNNPPEIRLIVFDFSFHAWSEDSKKTLKEALKDLDIGILINNVGLSYPSAQMFDELDEEFLDDLISVNLRSTFYLTRLVLPGMRQRRRGAILCVGSGAGSLPSEPLYAAYGSVKAAVSSFCNSLKVEVTDDNIIVQCHTPLLIKTKLSKVRRTSLTVLSPERYARDAIKSLEEDNRLIPSWITATQCPSLIHSIMLVLISHVVPIGLWNRIRFGQTMGIRSHYMRKAK